MKRIFAVVLAIFVALTLNIAFAETQHDHTYGETYSIYDGEYHVIYCDFGNCQSTKPDSFQNHNICYVPITEENENEYCFDASEGYYHAITCSDCDYWWDRGGNEACTFVDGICTKCGRIREENYLMKVCLFDESGSLFYAYDAIYYTKGEYTFELPEFCKDDVTTNDTLTYTVSEDGITPSVLCVLVSYTNKNRPYYYEIPETAFYFEIDSDVSTENGIWVSKNLANALSSYQNIFVPVNTGVAVIRMGNCSTIEDTILTSSDVSHIDFSFE